MCKLHEGVYTLCLLRIAPRSFSQWWRSLRDSPQEECRDSGVLGGTVVRLRRLVVLCRTTLGNRRVLHLLCCVGLSLLLGVVQSL